MFSVETGHSCVSPPRAVSGLDGISPTGQPVELLEVLPIRPRPTTFASGKIGCRRRFPTDASVVIFLCSEEASMLGTDRSIPNILCPVSNMGCSISNIRRPVFKMERSISDNQRSISEMDRFMIKIRRSLFGIDRSMSVIRCSMCGLDRSGLDQDSARVPRGAKRTTQARHRRSRVTRVRGGGTDDQGRSLPRGPWWLMDKTVAFPAC